MKTTTRHLCKQLKDFNPVSDGDDNVFSYCGICKYSDASENNVEGQIYISKLSTLVSHPSVPGAVCYICIDDCDYEKMSSSYMDIPIILLDTDADVSELFSFVLQMFFKANLEINRYQEELLELMANGASMSTILQTATKEFGNPFIIFDKNFSLVAHSIPKDLDLPAARDVVSNKFANVDVLKKLADEGIMDMLHHTTRPRLVNLPNGYQKLVVNVFDGMECVGLVCYYNYINPFEEDDYEKVGFVAKIIGRFFHSREYASSNWTPYDYILNHYLTNDNPKPNIAANLNVSFPPQMRVMVIEHSNIMQMHDIPLKFIENTVLKMLPRIYSNIYSENVIFVAKASTFEEEKNYEFFEWLNSFIEKYGLHCGISNVITDISQCRQAYEEAFSAASIGPKLIHDKKVFNYLELTIPHMLELLSKEHNMSRFCHPAFKQLKEYDNQYNTQYLECLKIYLKYNGNMADCASYFSIHYNSIKYRLKVIQDVCGIDLHDTNTFMHLCISRMIYELNEAENTENDVSN